jgi:hypothetical protein
MKPLLLLGISLLSISACAPPPPPPAPVAQPVAATAPANTTTAFDGNYSAVATVTSPPGCPNLSFPNLIISNGLAVLQGANLTFRGYVTQQGALYMNSPTGQQFSGQFDPHSVLTSRLSGPNCAYNVTWNRAS